MRVGNQEDFFAAEWDRSFPLAACLLLLTDEDVNDDELDDDDTVLDDKQDDVDGLCWSYRSHLFAALVLVHDDDDDDEVNAKPYAPKGL